MLKLTKRKFELAYHISLNMDHLVVDKQTRRGTQNNKQTVRNVRKKITLIFMIAVHLSIYEYYTYTTYAVEVLNTQPLQQFLHLSHISNKT